MPDEPTSPPSATPPPSSPPASEPSAPSQHDLSPENSDSILDQSLREAFRSEGADIPKGDEPEQPPEPTTPPEPKPEAGKPPAEPKGGDDEPPVDPETIKPPKFRDQKSAEGWNTLKKNNSRAWNALNRATDEIKQLKAALGERANMSAAEIEKLQKEAEELRGLRAVVEYEHDPEFISKYDQPAETVQNQMEDMLRQMGVREDVIKSVDYTDPGSVTRVAKVIEEKVDSITANRFLKRGEELVDLWEKRNKVLQEHRGKYKEFWQERRKKAQMSGVEEEARMTKRVDEVAALKDEAGSPQYPFLIEHPIPPTATKAQIAQIEAMNKTSATMRQKLATILKANTPEERAEVCIAAVAAAFINQRYRAAQAKIKSLEESLKKYNDITSERGGAGAPPAPKASGSLDLEDSLNAAFPQFKSRV